MTETREYIPVTNFINIYPDLREKEGRNYTDEEVAGLPNISTFHKHNTEWIKRQHSCKSFLHYLKSKNRNMDILEVGCGNGWLSAKMVGTVSGSVTGIDINLVEIEQARRVFKKIENLRFLQGDFQAENLKNNYFDVIVFAASIQYFPSLSEILQIALKHLKPNGEVHIFDSHLYKRTELPAAKERSKDYFEKIGFPEMSDHYFHHCISDLNSFNHKIIYDPNSFTNKLFRNKNPFYWIKIQQP